MECHRFNEDVLDALGQLKNSGEILVNSFCLYASLKTSYDNIFWVSKQHHLLYLLSRNRTIKWAPDYVPKKQPRQVTLFKFFKCHDK